MILQTLGTVIINRHLMMGAERGKIICLALLGLPIGRGKDYLRRPFLELQMKTKEGSVRHPQPLWGPTVPKLNFFNLS